MPMPITVYFAPTALWDEYRAAMVAALEQAGLDATLIAEAPDPAAVDYIVYAPTARLQDFTPFTRTRAVLSLWAGVERIVGNPTLTQPLCRMVDPAMTETMVAWVTGHVLRHHLGMDRHIVNPGHLWDPVSPPLPRERPVAVLGMGALGAASARMIASLGFPVTGWSTGPKDIPGIPCLHGDDGLAQVLSTAQIVVTLLPKTPGTENLLDARRLAMLPRGACIVNPGRGPIIDDDALLAALDSGQVGHATLDVFRTEPLPADHPFWAHPGVTVTPHIAADTRPDTSAHVIADNIRRSEGGLPLLYLVDRTRGY
jgi:glyoxylate/hydroxypyruvate reductase A